MRVESPATYDSQGKRKTEFTLSTNFGTSGDFGNLSVAVPSLRSGFRLRAPASLTPAERLKVGPVGFEPTTNRL